VRELLHRVILMRKTRQQKVAEMRSNPPAMATAAEDDLSSNEDQIDV